MWRHECSISEILVLKVVQSAFQEGAGEDFGKLMVICALVLGIRQANYQECYIGVITSMIW